MQLFLPLLALGTIVASAPAEPSAASCYGARAEKEGSACYPTDPGDLDFICSLNCWDVVRTFSTRAAHVSISPIQFAF